MTIEESMNIKFEKCNAFVKNVVEIDSLGENMEKISLKDSQIQEDDKSNDDEHGEVQDVEVEPTHHFRRIRDTQQVISKISS